MNIGEWEEYYNKPGCMPLLYNHTILYYPTEYCVLYPAILLLLYGDVLSNNNNISISTRSPSVCFFAVNSRKVEVGTEY